ncbi:hypothetical protein GO003_021155 [Methylicorpusculum oleiharenae]|uniref:hypothetical protein n=1 Tax=Methylicorpusculum oleiharenae TaxID=1338687 RepID=UPI00135B1BDA|nr:hypothetical protein [Methylicorpusculum oleiharenae]MCD2452894.1 hypothetical protein [Methylicorpusculum oleiharenae]
METIQQKDEELGGLKDKIAILKGEKVRPNFKPSGIAQATYGKQSLGTGEDQTKRSGSRKRNKTQQLVIYEERVIRPSYQASDTRFKGFRY